MDSVPTTVSPSQKDRPEMIALIVPDLDESYGELDAQHRLACYRWRIFRQLFANGNRERIELMAAISWPFFDDFHSLLADAVFLHICRMTDDVMQGKHENLVLDQLCNGLDQAKHGLLIQQLKQRLVDIKTKCEAIRVHRRKRIAHFDKPTMLGPPDSVLPGVRLDMVDAALKGIGDYLNLFRQTFYDDERGYEAMGKHDYNGNMLIEDLKRAMTFRELASQDWRLNKRMEDGPFGKA